MLARFPITSEHDVRKHIFISMLMDTQNMRLAIFGDDYNGNHINFLYAKDILGHNTYLKFINEMINAGILKRQEKYNEYKKQLHFYEPLELTIEGEFTVPSNMVKVNNSIDNLINHKLNNFSVGGNIVLDNLQDQKFGIDCSLMEYQTYCKEHYPDYCERKKQQWKLEEGKRKKCKPRPFEEYQKRYEITWNVINRFLASDRSMAWRYVEDDDKFAHRVYTFITGCPKFLRQRLTYNGERLALLDLKQSGPSFLAKILHQWEPWNDYSRFIKGGDNLYEFLQEKFDKKDNRDAAKRIYNIWAYGNNNTYYGRILKCHFPEASKVMELIKSIELPHNPTKEKYKNLACLVYQEESRVFRMIWHEIDKEVGWFLTCHDEILVPEGKSPHALGIMHEILSQELGNIPFDIRPE